MYAENTFFSIKIAFARPCQNTEDYDIGQQQVSNVSDGVRNKKKKSNLYHKDYTWKIN